MLETGKRLSCVLPVVVLLVVALIACRATTRTDGQMATSPRSGDTAIALPLRENQNAAHSVELLDSQGRGNDIGEQKSRAEATGEGSSDGGTPVADPMEIQTSLLRITIGRVFWMESRHLMGNMALREDYAQLAPSAKLYNNRSRRPVRIRAAYLIGDDGQRYEDFAWRDAEGMRRSVSELEVSSLSVNVINPIFVVPRDGCFTFVIEHYSGEKAEFRLNPRSWEEHLEDMKQLAPSTAR